MRGVGRSVVVSAALMVGISMSACTSDSTSLAQVTADVASGGSGTGSTSSAATGSATSTSTSTSTPATAPTKTTIIRDPLPDGLPQDAAPAVEAWFAYWEYLAQALSDPQAAGAIDNLGSVATGTAASDSANQIRGLKDKNRHTVGPTRVGVSKASTNGTTATVCSTLHDDSVDVDANGVPVEAAIPRVFVFNATMTKQGPAWRAQKLSRVESC